MVVTRITCRLQRYIDARKVLAIIHMPARILPDALIGSPSGSEEAIQSNPLLIVVSFHVIKINSN